MRGPHIRRDPRAIPTGVRVARSGQTQVQIPARRVIHRSAATRGRSCSSTFIEHGSLGCVTSGSTSLHISIFQRQQTW